MAREEKKSRPIRMKLRKGAAELARQKRENKKFTPAQKRRFEKCLKKFDFESDIQFENRKKKMIVDNVIIDKRKALIERRHRSNKKVRYSRVRERQFYELKFYGIALFNISVKYAIHTEALRMLVFFYDNREFTREEFLRVYKITELKPKFNFKYFVDNGMFRQVTYKEHYLKKKSKDIKTNKYKLTVQSIFRVNMFYELYMTLLEMDEGHLSEELVSKEMQKTINDIERECQQIIAGKLSPETIESFKQYL